MRVLDLFSGIGGFSLGLESVGMQTVGFCEQDKFCQKVLNKHWPDVPIHEDITKLDGRAYRDTVELVCGGFPCQPFSVAGERRGAEDDRALWSEMFRVIREVQPAYVIGENVPGIISIQLDNVLSDLEGEGYATQTFVIPACAVDAQHRRDRVWVVAHSDSDSESNDPINEEQRSWELVADTSGEGLQGREWIPNDFRQDIGRETGSYVSTAECSHDSRRAKWLPEPPVGRVAHGVPDRTHRLKSLGNAVVPQVVAEIGRIIMKFEENQIG